MWNILTLLNQLYTPKLLPCHGSQQVKICPELSNSMRKAVPRTEEPQGLKVEDKMVPKKEACTANSCHFLQRSKLSK